MPGMSAGIVPHFSGLDVVMMTKVQFVRVIDNHRMIMDMHNGQLLQLIQTRRRSRAGRQRQARRKHAPQV